MVLVLATGDKAGRAITDGLATLRAAAAANGLREVSSNTDEQHEPMPQFTTIKVPVDRITRTVTDGKVHRRVHGERFDKYGVAVYKEVLSTIDFTAAQLALDVLPVTGTMTVELVNGKAKRVTALDLF